MVAWGYYDKFEPVMQKYLPLRGEGENKAEQVVTAVNKLVYKYYNDGDVFDNQHFLIGWCNDLSSYANWLAEYTDKKPLLMGVWECMDDDEYEELLRDLADSLLDIEKLSELSKEPKIGSIYKCEGPFKFEEFEDDDFDEEEYWED